jgi:hypothetical protein
MWKWYGWRRDIWFETWLKKWWVICVEIFIGIQEVWYAVEAVNTGQYVTSNIEWTHTHMQFVRSMHYLFLVVFLFVCFCMYLLRECWVKVECTSYISLFFSIFSYTFFVLCINIYYICHSKTYMKIRTKTIYIWMNEIMNFASLWSDIILFSM